jgi:hypothetical protein
MFTNCCILIIVNIDFIFEEELTIFEQKFISQNE